MSTHLINLGDSALWPPLGTQGSYQITVVSSSTIYISTGHGLVIFDECSGEPKVDPKLERQYNLAIARNNKNEMRRLEKLIANNKQGRYR